MLADGRAYHRYERVEELDAPRESQKANDKPRYNGHGRRTWRSWA